MKINPEENLFKFNSDYLQTEKCNKRIKLTSERVEHNINQQLHRHQNSQYPKAQAK